MAWYYMKDLERIGPIDDAQFASLIAQGIISARTWVWRTEMNDWKAYSDVAAEIASPKTEVNTVLHSQTASTVSQDSGDSVVEENRASIYSCVSYDQVKNKQWQNLNEDQETTTEVCVCFAGLWKRFCALFLDFQVLGLVIGLALKTLARFLGFSVTQSLSVHGFSMIQGETIDFAMLTILITIYIVYETWMLSKYGATLGKIVMRLRVVRSDGSPITYMQAFARYWAKVLSGLLFCIGFIIAVFDPEKRSLHDRICGTRVIRIR